ncbi:unnamed protein product, partial [Prorocentrum cordatum]
MAATGPSRALTPAALTNAVMQVLPETDPANTSIGECIRRRARLGRVSAPRGLAPHLGMPETGYDGIADDVSTAVQAALAQQESPAQRMSRLAADLGNPATDAKRPVRVVTVCRVLPDAVDQTDLADVESMSSEDVGRAQLGASNGNGGGVVKKMAVFK